MSLTDRVRGGSEAAPWVVKEIERLEQQLAAKEDERNRQLETEAGMKRQLDDAWQEIAVLKGKLDELAAEDDDGILCHDCMDTGWLENRVEGRYVCPCIRETEPYQELQQQLSKLTMERDEAVSAVQRLTEGVPFDAVVIADGIRRGIAQQLTEREKQIVMLRDALKDIKAVAKSSVITHGYDIHHNHNIGLCVKALAATADLSGYILCDAEPVCFIPDDAIDQLTPPKIRLLSVPLITYNGQNHSPLYKAKDPKCS
jgi:hypothetical protein